jgi:P4 family phage/plasmid primase-like protien
MSGTTVSPIVSATERYAFVYQPNGFVKGDALPSVVAAWSQARRDIYFLPGEPKEDAVFTTTPKKEAMAGSRMVWADIDPPATIWDKKHSREAKPGALATWLSAIETKASNLSPPPSCLIRSGRGLWVMWYLDELAPPDVVENINRWLRDELDGDPAAVNVNRVARMPGTRNSKTGQLAEIAFDAPDRVYRVADFQQVPERARAIVDTGLLAAGGDAATPKKIGDLAAFADQYKLKPLVCAVITHGHDPDNPQRWPSRSEAVWFVCCEMARAYVPEDEQLGILLERTNGISESIYTTSAGKPVLRPERYARRQVSAAAIEVDTGPAIIVPRHGLATARLFCRRRHPDLIRHDELWLTYRKGGFYDELADDTVLSELALWLETCSKRTGDGLTSVVPSTKLVNETFAMLKRAVHVPAEQHDLPCWRDDGPNPREIVACANGLFHMPSMELLPHTPDFLTRNAVPCSYDPAAACPLWMEKLGEWFAEQPEEIALLQEWFGLMLVGDTSYQKALMLIGPKRSGKGTIGRTLTALVGARNVANPSISDLNGRFGLEPLVGKLLAIIADGRIGHDTDLSALSENLLRVIGEDAVNVDRKGIPALTNVRLATRVLIFANELPRFSDDTGVIASRFMPVMMHRSFFNNEDRTLEQRLLREQSGILNWAVEGWKRLTERGYFELPRQTREAVGDLEELASPLKAWINERCELDQIFFTPTVELYADYRSWCTDQGRKPFAANTFAQKLKAAAPVESERPRAGKGSRPTGYRGIGLVGGLQANEQAFHEAMREYDANRCHGVTDPYAADRDQQCNGTNCMRLNGLCPARAKFGFDTERNDSKSDADPVLL